MKEIVLAACFVVWALNFVHLTLCMTRDVHVPYDPTVWEIVVRCLTSSIAYSIHMAFTITAQIYLMSIIFVR